MNFLEEPQELIRQSKKKFALYGFLSLIVFFISVGFGYSVFTKSELDQIQIQNSYKNVTSQIDLVQKIQLILNQMRVAEDENNWVKLQKNLRENRINLAKKGNRFRDWLKETDKDYAEQVQSEISQQNISNAFYRYLNTLEKFEKSQFSSPYTKTSEIISQTELLREDILKTLEKVQIKVQSIQSKAFDNYKNLVLFLIFLSVFQVLLIWWVVFVPLFKTIKIQHEKILESVLQIETANRSKTDFLANISHEIRTPMTAILGYTDILKKDGNSDVERDDAIRIIDQNADHLLGLIDDILDIAKIEAGKFQVEKQETDFAQLLNQVFSLLNVKAQDKNLDLEFSFETKVPESLMIDPKRVKQILCNIVGNAIKFTDRGKVSVLVSFFENSSEIMILVTDTGIGMNKGQVKKLFRPFQQADTSVSRKYGGSGLGLVLSRDLARQMGGDIRVLKSLPGKGTDIEIRLAVGLLSGSKLISDFSTHIEDVGEEVQERILEGRKILVVDDAKENARLFSLYLASAGAEVQAAYRGDEAIEKAQKESFDVILLDLQMPGKDGFSVIKELKSSGLSCPFVALTAHGMREEKMKTAQAGFSDHIVKPVKSHVLINRVRDLL